jgi:hypothetical protein
MRNGKKMRNEELEMGEGGIQRKKNYKYFGKSHEALKIR